VAGASDTATQANPVGGSQDVADSQQQGEGGIKDGEGGIKEDVGGIKEGEGGIKEGVGGIKEGGGGLKEGGGGIKAKGAGKKRAAPKESGGPKEPRVAKARKLTKAAAKKAVGTPAEGLPSEPGALPAPPDVLTGAAVDAAEGAGSEEAAGAVKAKAKARKAPRKPSAVAQRAQTAALAGAAGAPDAEAQEAAGAGSVLEEMAIALAAGLATEEQIGAAVAASNVVKAAGKAAKPRKPRALSVSFPPFFPLSSCRCIMVLV